MSAVLVPLDPNLHVSTGDSKRDETVRRMVAMAPAPLNLNEARRIRDIKVQQVLDRAEQINDGWGRVAYLYLVGYSRRHHRFIAQDVVRAFKDDGMTPPHSDKAFGKIFQLAAKVGCIKASGYAPAPHRHASPAVLWESQLYQEAA